MSEQAGSSAGATTTAAGGKTPPSFGKRLRNWTLIGGGALLVLFLLYRWAGTSHDRGVVQRVYEKDSIFRVEYVDLDGTVHVAENRDIMMPYVKFDTADLHAELSRMAATQDVVDLTVWGFRFEWFSVFPNVVGVEFVRSAADRQRLRAEQLADVTLGILREKGLLKGGEGVRGELVEGLQAALAIPEPQKPSGAAEK